jgi:hypothetical protein
MVDPRIKNMTPEQLHRFLNTSDIRGQYGGQFGFEADWGDLQRQAIQQLGSGAGAGASPTPAPPPATVQPVDNSRKPPGYMGPVELGAQFRLAAPQYNTLVQNLLNKQGLEERTALDRFGQRDMAEQAQQQAALASRGGLRSGSAERLAKNAMVNSLLGRQDLRNQGAMQRLGIESDLGQKQIVANAMADQYNIQNAIGEGRAKHVFDVGTWMTQEQLRAAKELSDTLGQEDKGDSFWNNLKDVVKPITDVVFPGSQYVWPG